MWLASTPDGAGVVWLAARLFTTQRALLQDQYAFVRLPRDVHPQEALSMLIALPSIMSPGGFLVELDMVDELGNPPFGARMAPAARLQNPARSAPTLSGSRTSRAARWSGLLR